MRDRISEALSALSLPSLGNYYGLELTKSCKSPFRDDSNPSFSVWESKDKWRWKDQATGEHGDTIDFLAKWEGVTNTEAVKLFCDLALGEVISRKGFDSFGVGTEQQFRDLAKLRRLSVAGLKLASERGVLRFGNAYGHSCWIVTDESGRVSEARRMDGEKFFGQHKAMAKKGADKSWPVGIASKSSGLITAILIAEGGPDLLASYHLIELLGKSEQVIAVALLGRKISSIHEEALPLFKGKEVILCPHNDSDGGGVYAMEEWSDQIEDADKISFFDFSEMQTPDGNAISDLNDFAIIATPAEAAVIFL